MNSGSDSDAAYMARALELASIGEGSVSPNPMVGAIVARNGTVIGEGYHQRFGGPHAEVNALRKAGPDSTGATIYVTLEPCVHYGKTPPCVDEILAAGIKRVVVARQDANATVDGEGIKQLRRAGLDVAVGVLEERARRLNEKYEKFVAAGLPFVTLKIAQTLDGRIADSTHNARWITSKPARKFVHSLRRAHDAVLVGAGTVVADDPSLTIRHVKGRQPTRVILDGRLSAPASAKVYSSNDSIRTVVVASESAPKERLAALSERGVELFVFKDKHAPRQRIDLDRLLEGLAEKGITSILVEGGSGVFSDFLKRGLVDKLLVLVAPKVLGGGVQAVESSREAFLRSAQAFDFTDVRMIGPDVLIEAVPSEGY